jgi:alpha-tubulin suppressor-like RCC1 family protein
VATGSIARLKSTSKIRLFRLPLLARIPAKRPDRSALVAPGIQVERRGEAIMRGNYRWTLMSLVMALGLLGVAATESSAQYSLRWRLNPDDFVEITAGNYHTCARKNNGNVYCWGKNDMGQVGSGGEVETHAQFVMVASQVDAGTNHTCAIDFAGTAFCWGNNLWGALGANDTMASMQGWGSDHWSVPIAVDGGLTFSSISAGMYSTCGTASTGLFCWGKLMTPQFGAGMPSPVQVTPWNGYTRVSVGYQHACVMYTWGTREAHCFGDGSKGQTALDPNYFYLADFPSQTMFGSGVSRVTTQVDFSCVDQMSGIVQCAGDNTYGQLGNGSIGMPWFTPYPQTVGNGAALRGVATGSSHACALDPNGAAFCWGSGSYGKLGTGATGSSGSPQAVSGGFAFRAIAAGAYHTCGIATNNQIYCWGNNSWGQLGIGRLTTSFFAPSVWDPVSF